jgi:hypothetical protein
MEIDHVEDVQVIKNNIQVDLNKIGLHTPSSKLGKIACFCEQGDERSGFMMGRELLVYQSYV